MKLAIILSLLSLSSSGENKHDGCENYLGGRKKGAKKGLMDKATWLEYLKALARAKEYENKPYILNVACNVVSIFDEFFFLFGSDCLSTTDLVDDP